VKNRESRDQIIGEWDRWVSYALPEGIEASENHLLGFFSHLKAKCPDMLEFGDVYDRYQTVHAWLLEAKRIL